MSYKNKSFRSSSSSDCNQIWVLEWYPEEDEINL